MHIQSDMNKFDILDDFLAGLEPEELRHLVKDAYEGDEEAFLNKFYPEWKEELQAMNTKRYAQSNGSEDLKNRLIDYIYEASDEFGLKLMRFETSIFPKVRDNTYTAEQIAEKVLPLVQEAAKSFEEYYETKPFDVTTLDAVAHDIADEIIMTTRPGMINANHLKKAIAILGQQKRKIITGEELYQKLKEIVDNGQAQRINGSLVDTFSASAVVQVADALTEQNRAKFLSFPLVKIVNIAFQMLK